VTAFEPSSAGPAGEARERPSVSGFFSRAGDLVRGFYKAMPKSGGYAAPAVHALFWLFAAVLAELVVSRFRPGPLEFGWAVELVWLAVGPLFFLALGFGVSAALFVVWHLMGSKENYQTAFRCWAYAAPAVVLTAVLGAVPYLGLLGLVYFLYLLVAASLEVHDLPPKRSWIVWGVLGGGALILAALSNFFQPSAAGGAPDFSAPAEEFNVPEDFQGAPSAK
jgi:hypothetical protein